jgi:hypothetical protein
MENESTDENTIVVPGAASRTDTSLVELSDTLGQSTARQYLAGLNPTLHPERVRVYSALLRAVVSGRRA